MQVTVDIPDQYLTDLIPAGTDPARSLLEESVAAAYRDRRIGPRTVGILLAIESSLEVNAFLNKHQATGLSVAELQEDLSTMDALHAQRASSPRV